jgi:Mg/Co/Ni transporter MgtE
MKLSKEMTDQIEIIHRMDKEELYETYEEMIPDSSSENIYEVKEELAYLIYFVLHGKEPNEFKRDKISRYFQNLIMQDELKAYRHSRSTQRIIRRIYRMEYGEFENI